MKENRKTESGLPRWLRCLVHRLRDPFRRRELEGIRTQMTFWHEEERRTMEGAFSAFDRGDYAEYERLWNAHKNATREYERLWNAHKNATRRCKAEVSDRLATFR